MQPIRFAATSRQADEWALVLSAAGIPNAVEPDGGGWLVLAAPDDAVRAHAALGAYDEERRSEVAPPPAPTIEPYPWMSGVVVGLLLLWLFSVTGTRASGSAWVERGAAAAGRIMSGEVWRAVTALTLHADVVHVAGNALATAVLLPPIVQRLGAGATLLLVLLTGAVGNVLAAAAHDPRHVAVGASTATFGALGVLVALRLVSRERSRRSKRWMAPVAGLILLAMLGAAPGSDLTAHAFGFLAGLMLGAIAGLTLRRPPAAVQWAVGVLAGLTLSAGWYLAMR
jgi:membrane associated rhomboid family serine protease